MAHPDAGSLSELLDGDLSSARAREVERHLRDCPECSDLLDELAEVRRRARALPHREPERDLWPEIEETILQGKGEGAEVIRLHPDVPDTSAGRARGLRLSVPQAVAAGLALALFSGAVGAFLDGPGPAGPGMEVAPAVAWVQEVKRAEPGLEISAREAVRLEELLARHRSDLDSATVRTLEKNLALIDEAIRESIAALRDDPGNAFLRDHLARSVEAKESYLREAASLVVPVS